MVIGMAVVKVKYGFNGEEIVVEPTPTDTQLDVQAIPTLIPGFELLNKIPYQGTGFVVEKYINPNELAIKIKGIDKKLAERMVYKWIAENKVATGSYKLKITE
jgi:hypothetical protein